MEPLQEQEEKMLNKNKGTLTNLSIGELSDQASCNIETIRYYERIGLLPQAARSAAGRRFYSDADVRRLSFIRRARALGFPLDRIRQLLALNDREATDCCAVRNLAETQLLEVRAKLAELAKIEGVLDDMVTRCQPGVIPECPILDALEGEARSAPQS